jgi:hypothetical protein
MANSIVGRWVHELPMNMGEIVYVFREDGTYDYRSSKVQQSGSYEISGNLMHFPKLGNTIEFSVNDNKFTIYPPGDPGGTFRKR